MRLNEECVEKLMLYFEENLSCDTGKIKPIKLKQVYIQGFTDEEFFTAAQFCAVKGFISGPPGTKAIKDVPLLIILSSSSNIVNIKVINFLFLY